MINNVYTEIYDIERFSRAKQTIRSPITIENEQETQRKTRETIQSVEDRYNISEEITDERVVYIEEIFDAIHKLEDEENNKDDIDREQETNETSSKENEEVVAAPLTNEEKVQRLRQILSSEITEMISEKVLIQLIKTSPEEREEAQEILITALTETLNNGVRKENIQSAIADVKQE